MTAAAGVSAASAGPAAEPTPGTGPTVPGRGFGLYVHWPFCVSKCPYCDFNSHVADRVDTAAWQAALCADLDHIAAETAGRTLDSVFFGGGTPSLMPPQIVGALLERAATHWTVTAETEITLEANPSSVEAAKFADFRASGVNRVSIGVQSFDDTALTFLGRAHDADAASHAISIAERTFPRFSFDLIYALPGQTPADWRAALRAALARAGDHLSLYQLTIEKGTAFFSDHRRGAFRLPDDDTAAEIYDLTGEETARAGLPAYEISNHAAPGGECRHNLLYWQGADYAGIGPGAHGRITAGGVRRATEQIPAPDAWLEAVRRQGHGIRKATLVSIPEQIIELLLTGLRLKAGINRSVFENIAGMPIESALDMARIAPLEAAGLLTLDGAGLRASPEGRMRLNSLIARIVPDSDT